MERLHCTKLLRRGIVTLSNSCLTVVQIPIQQGWNSIDIFLGPKWGPEPGPSHVWSVDTCLYFQCPSTEFDPECGPDLGPVLHPKFKVSIELHPRTPSWATCLPTSTRSTSTTWASRWSEISSGYSGESCIDSIVIMASRLRECLSNPKLVLLLRKFLDSFGLKRRKLYLIQIFTEVHLMVRSRFGRICYCCSLPAQPRFAWVLLQYVLRTIFCTSV